MNPKSDGELVRAVQEGSIRAFEQLVNRYQKRLVAFVTRLTHDEAMAEDVVIETLFSLYKTIDRVDSSKKFSSYLYTSVRNTAYSSLRQKKPHVSLTEDFDIPDHRHDEYALLHPYDQQQVADALQKIPVSYATVLRLYYFDQLSYEEIANKVRLPINTVRTHLSRGKSALRKIII